MKSDDFSTILWRSRRAWAPARWQMPFAAGPKPIHPPMPSSTRASSRRGRACAKRSPPSYASTTRRIASSTTAAGFAHDAHRHGSNHTNGLSVTRALHNPGQEEALMRLRTLATTDNTGTGRPCLCLPPCLLLPTCRTRAGPWRPCGPWSRSPGSLWHARFSPGPGGGCGGGGTTT
jgi:hypothetical protein